MYGGRQLKAIPSPLIVNNLFTNLRSFVPNYGKENYKGLMDNLLLIAHNVIHSYYVLENETISDNLRSDLKHAFRSTAPSQHLVDDHYLDAMMMDMFNVVLFLTELIVQYDIGVNNSIVDINQGFIVID